MVRRFLTLVCLALMGCDGIIGEPLATAVGAGATGGPDVPMVSKGGPGSPVIERFDCAPVVAVAPADVLCTLQVRHEAGGVTCTVDVGDGRAATVIESCEGSARLLPYRFEKEAALVVRVTAAVANALPASAAVELNVTAAPNRAPVVETFSGDPLAGAAPFTTSLSWRAVDPDGDALTCTLNGTPVACVETNRPFSTSSLGATALVLDVTDSRGAKASKSLTVTVRAAVGDVRISKAEWGQTIVSERLRLVAGKPALLRLYVLADKPGLTGVTVDVEASANGATLGSMRAQGPASPPTTEVASDLSQQYRVTVPAEWVVAGVRITATVDKADAVPESNESNNVLALSPTVGTGNVLDLTVVPVLQGGLTGTAPNLNGIVTRLWPVRVVNQQARATYTFQGSALTGSNTAGWGDLLEQLRAVRRADNSTRGYYGVVKVSYQSGVAGIGYVGQGTAVGRDDSSTTAAHELGHNLGRQHAPCGGPAGPDPSYPYSGANIGSWGYDAFAQKLMAPTSYKDVMSYCEPEWVSDYNYNAVQQYLETRPAAYETGLAPYQLSVLVSGRIVDGQVSMSPMHRLWARPEALNDLGELVLTVRLADGSVRSVPMAVETTGDGDEQHFGALVPDVGRIDEASLSRAGTVLWSARALDAWPHPEPKLTRDGERVWLSFHGPPGAVAAVSYVTPSGRTTLALKADGTEPISTQGLKPERGGHFEVSVSDGLNATWSQLPAR